MSEGRDNAIPSDTGNILEFKGLDGDVGESSRREVIDLI